MANDSKKWKVNQDIDLRFMGDVTVGDGESWTRTVIIQRKNTADIPPAILRDSCLLWNYIDNDVIERMSYKSDNFTKSDEKRYEFVAELWGYTLSWLKTCHGISFYAKNLGIEEGYGQAFARMPQMWIQPNFIIIEQQGGMDV